MSQPLRLCQHIYDTGGKCNSAAATGHNYCAAHVHYRARQFRMAQARARAERYDIKIPPLDSMQTIQSVLSQLGEALAADMIDLKRADRLIRVLNLASRNLLKADKWPSAPVFHSDQPVEVDVAKQYGLPIDLDLDTPPEIAFPPQETSQSVILSEGDASCASPESKDPLDSASGRAGLETDNRPPAADHSIKFGPEHPISPEFLELRDIHNTQGEEAQAVRYRQLERNRALRQLRTNRKRYVDLAWRLNIKWAAEQIAEKKVTEKLKEAGIAPVDSEPKDFDARVADEMKKVAVGTAEIDACLAGQEVNIA